jgi:hypothetical protein
MLSGFFAAGLPLQVYKKLPEGILYALGSYRLARIENVPVLLVEITINLKILEDCHVRPRKTVPEDYGDLP